jgi:uncharacterized protein (TIGR02996 family)
VSDRDALLRAICESPDDDAPRLIYADWLDEHGDPRQAEFIRVQIELAQLPSTDRAGHPLAAREQALWRDLRKWRYVLGDWLSLYIQTFERGFDTLWRGSVPSFLDAAPQLWRKGPIRVLALTFGSPAPGGSGGVVATVPILGKMREVRLRGPEVTDEWVADLVRSPHATGWRMFEISGEAVTDRTCAALANSPLAASGCTVNLYSPRISPAGRAALEAAFGFRQSVAEGW